MFEESSQGVQCLKKVWRVLSLTAALCSLKGFLLPETMTLCKNMRKLLLFKKKEKKGERHLRLLCKNGEEEKNLKPS